VAPGGNAVKLEAQTAARRVPGAARVAAVYYGAWLVVAAFIAQFVSVGSSNYVVGVFLSPPSLSRIVISASHATANR
jgi:hypothetical protein